jgi:hypothetical protein
MLSMAAGEQQRKKQEEERSDTVEFAKEIKRLLVLKTCRRLRSLITLDCRHKTTEKSLLVNEEMPISEDTSLVILKDS